MSKKQMNENSNVEEKEVMHLDDAARVKVLSPGMMVVKRFLRNKLAIIGIIIIISMFIFSFLGGMIMPYSQSQVFYTTEEIKKDYAGATKIEQFQIQTTEGAKLSSDIGSKLMIATGTGKNVFTSRDGSVMGISPEGNDVYVLYSLEKSDISVSDDAAYKAAALEGRNTFEKDGELYLFDGDESTPDVYKATELGVASMNSISGFSSDSAFKYDFCKNALIAMAKGESSFEADGSSYELDGEVIKSGGEDYALISDMNFNAVGADVYLSPAYKAAAMEAFEAGATKFEFADADGNMTEYHIENKNGQYLIKRYKQTRVIDTYASPSRAHWLGTDGNGMDLLARLMYGGRISLLIGFVVIFIEVLIGMIIGGISGFFGGWVDNVLMRLVDVIYCIPAMPLYLILGSIMDFYQASAVTRIYMLCIVMAIIGWVGIARIVRGQILSLREQEFMVAAEASGLSTRRRIFKHLIPNVIPQLIVFASMGLGDVILAEATLSFLGLGIKYPAASWGSIINAVNDSYVMTNYLFVWLPAGLFILLTVLAFNFIGDGLRDAFDPKMKR